MKNIPHNLVYSPQFHIPLGEPKVLSDGQFAIIVKRAHDKQEETITLNTLISLLTTAAKAPNAGSPSEASASKQ